MIVYKTKVEDFGRRDLHKIPCKKRWLPLGRIKYSPDGGSPHFALIRFCRLIVMMIEYGDRGINLIGENLPGDPLLPEISNPSGVRRVS